MARRRISAVRRRARDQSAQTIAQGVFAVARDLEGANRVDTPLGLPATAPLLYAAEMLASAVCQQRGWTDDERHEQVSQYLFAGVSETVIALVESFDEDHFQRWIEALQVVGSG